MENMDHNEHSVYLMYYHLIMVVKYRRKVINDPISERAKEKRVSGNPGKTLERSILEPELPICSCASRSTLSKV